MKVFIEKTGKDKMIKFEGDVAKLLSTLKLRPAEVLVVRDGELLTPDEKIEDNDEIKILSVISGG